MLDRMDDRVVELLTILVAIATLLTCLCYATIYFNPAVPFNPFPPDTPTPAPTDTPTMTPTLPPTWTPTNTPTNTPTPTPTFTNTPTWTPTWTPTRTPTPTFTFTATPIPPPTNTPMPPPYEVRSMMAGPHCSYTGVFGTVVDKDGLPLGGVQLQLVGENGWQSPIVTTDGAGKYEIVIQYSPIQGTWFVTVLENGQPASDRIGFRTSSGGCDAGTGKQRFMLDFQRVR